MKIVPAIEGTDRRSRVRVEKQPLDRDGLRLVFLHDPFQRQTEVHQLNRWGLALWGARRPYIERAHDAAVGLDNSITGPCKTGVDAHDSHARPPEHMYELESMGRVGPVQGTWEPRH